MRCLGILDEEAKGALSSLFAVASDDFKRSYSGGYVVPYAKIGTPSAAAQDMDKAEELWVSLRKNSEGKVSCKMVS